MSFFFKTAGSYIIVLPHYNFSLLKVQIFDHNPSRIGLNVSDSWVQRKTVYKDSVQMIGYYAYL